MNTNILQSHPSDIAEEIISMKKKDRNLRFLKLSPEMKVEVFSYLSPKFRAEIVRDMTEAEYSEVLNKLSPDDRTEIFEKFPDQLIKYSINLLDADEKQVALKLIGYEEESIARLMTPNYIQTKANKTVKQVFEHIKKFGKSAETLNHIYVVDDEFKLIDDLKIGQLLLVDEDTPISDLMDNRFVGIRTTTPVEEALEIFEKYDRSALPIITEAGVLVGIVTGDDILDAIQERDTEDIQKFGGLKELDMSYTETSLMELVRKRAGWLIILFVGEMLTASAMAIYDEQIEKAVVLALFVPLVISSGGNSGSQAASLIIRSLAIGELKLKNWWYVFKKEVASGLMLGAILGAVGFSRILVWHKVGLYDYGEFWLSVALTIGVSLVFIVLWGSLAGALIPFVLRSLKMDPATASAPFVATLVDVSGLIIYFSIAMMFLSGKML